MNPIYKFTLSANGGAERAAFPVYRDDLAKDFELQSNEQYYRAKLSGKLTFVGRDYTFIYWQTFETKFGLKIYISYDAGQTWAEYWNGQFWKTNCEFDADNRNVTVTPETIDQYTTILGGLEKEFDLIQLAPEIVQVMLDKRPMIQVYVPGQSSIGCFLSGMYWEQECEPEDDENVLVQTGDGKLNFALNKTNREIDVVAQGSPTIPDVFIGATDATEFSNGTYKIVLVSGGGVTQWQIVRASDNVVLWNLNNPTVPGEFTLQPVSGSGATGTVTLNVRDVSVYARYICDVEKFGTQNTSLIGTDDIVPDNRNYSRVIGYYAPDMIFFSQNLSTDPTPFGLYQPGKYYAPPTGAWSYWNYYPVAKNSWGRISTWFAFVANDWNVERSGRKPYTLRDAFPLASVISVLLGQIDANLTHQESTAYSAFLYGTNPLNGLNQRLMITPKSNMITLGYDQPAQKAPITLKQVLNMLRDCFRCYWFIDESYKFRIEHVSYFMNGGAYPGTTGYPVIGRDLTTEENTRNGKKLTFGTSKYRFDKPEMAARYQFGWMDDVTQLFDGNPIDIVSKYVNPDNIENIDIAQFTSDVDYILLNPDEISKDGFVLLSAESTGLVDIKSLTFEQGGLRGTGRTGYSYDSNKTTVANRIRTQLLQLNTKYILLNDFSAGYNISAHCYDAEDCLIDFYTVVSGTILTLPDGCKSVAFVLFRTDNANLVPSEALTVNGYFNQYKLPYQNFYLDGANHILQNPYVAFVFLQNYYAYDMPAKSYIVNGINKIALGVKRLKTQTLNFPSLADPNTMQLIKTLLGNGTIQKMSVNLSSRNANTTLKYDTE